MHFKKRDPLLKLKTNQILAVILLRHVRVAVNQPGRCRAQAGRIRLAVLRPQIGTLRCEISPDITIVETIIRHCRGLCQPLLFCRRAYYLSLRIMLAQRGYATGMVAMMVGIDQHNVSKVRTTIVLVHPPRHSSLSSSSVVSFSTDCSILAT